MEDEGGFADTARAVEEERLRDAVVVEGVVVENRFHQRPGDYPPCFPHHLILLLCFAQHNPYNRIESNRIECRLILTLLLTLF